MQNQISKVQLVKVTIGATRGRAARGRPQGPDLGDTVGPSDR